MLRRSLGVLALLAGTPVQAAWTTTSDAVRAAAKDPAIAATLAAMNRIDVATVAGDRDAFADDALVNSPFNTSPTRRWRRSA